MLICRISIPMSSKMVNASSKLERTSSLRLVKDSSGMATTLISPPYRAGAVPGSWGQEIRARYYGKYLRTRSELLLSSPILSNELPKSIRPHRDTLPYVGVKPITPQKLAGQEMEPPVETPNAR